MSSDITGKKCIVTGANSGIGRVVARELSRMGGAVTMICRNQVKGEAALNEILRTTGSKTVELAVVDLASLEAVRTFARDYIGRNKELHILVNNAGLILGRRSTTPEGLETTFVVNYLSHFLLTSLLLDTMKASAPSRIVNVTSDAHFGTQIDFDDLQEEKSYGAMKSYQQSKLAQVFFTYVLAEKLKGTGVTVNCVHPGAVRTSWGNSSGMLSIGIRIARPFMIGPEKGADTVLYVATAPELQEVSGRYFFKRKERDSSKESHDPEAAQKLWEASESLTGLKQA